MKKNYLTMLLSIGLAIGAFAQNLERAKSHENIKKANQLRPAKTASSIKKVNHSKGVDELSLSSECKNELEQILSSYPEKKDRAFLKIENALLKNMTVLTTLEFSSYQAIIDKAPLNPIGEKEEEQFERARTIQRKYVSISELIK